MWPSGNWRQISGVPAVKIEMSRRIHHPIKSRNSVRLHHQPTPIGPRPTLSFFWHCWFEGTRGLHTAPRWQCAFTANCSHVGGRCCKLIAQIGNTWGGPRNFNHCNFALAPFFSHISWLDTAKSCQQRKRRSFMYGTLGYHHKQIWAHFNRHKIHHMGAKNSVIKCAAAS